MPWSARLVDYEPENIFIQLLNAELLDPNNGTNAAYYISFNTNVTVGHVEAIVDMYCSPSNLIKVMYERETLQNEGEEVPASLILYACLDVDPTLKMLIDVSSTAFISLHVIGEDLDSITDFVKEFRKNFPGSPNDVGDDHVVIKNWEMSPRGGAQHISRSIKINHWDDVSVNYPSKTRASLQRMHDWTPEAVTSGRIVLMYGAPGTGKSNALLSLMGSWNEWANFHQIWDPEKFFLDTQYLRTVLGVRQTLIGQPSKRQPNNKFNIIVLEDCDEYISVDAKEQSGQNLGRILNLTDGILGQSLNFLLIFTTNKVLRDFHPAIKRPGRCLAELKFDTFDKRSADAWLKAHGHTAKINKEETTLAELYEELSDIRHLTSQPDAQTLSTGQYL